MTDTVVKGTIVAHDATIPDGWVAITDGHITAIGTGPAPDAATVHDFGGDYVLPGAVDGQVHAGSARGLPGLESTTRSALAGGVTTIVDMPYDNPHPVNTAERFADKVRAVETYALCDVALYGTIVPGQQAAEIVPMIEAGAVAFKISAFESSPTRFPRIPADLMLDLFEQLAPTDLPVGLHNEDQEIVKSRTARCLAKGEESIHVHSTARPEAAELASTAHFFELGALSGAHAHPVHLSSGRGFDLAERYRAEGFRATGELCVHYLWFDPDSDGDRLGPLMKVNPPIRPGARDALWRALADGKVAFVSSDHASWTVEAKRSVPFFAAGAGIPGLATLVPAFFTLAEAHDADPWRLLAAYLCERPARFFGLAPRKGAIAVGADADLMVLRHEPQRWDSARAHDELDWSPFDGAEFTARVAATLLRGTLVWDGTSVLSGPGSGRFLRRGPTRWFTDSTDLSRQTE